MIRQGKVVHNVHAEFWAGGKFVSILDPDGLVIYKVFASRIRIINVFCHVSCRAGGPFHATVGGGLFAFATVRGPFRFVGLVLRGKIVLIHINRLRVFVLVVFSSAAAGSV